VKAKSEQFDINVWPPYVISVTLRLRENRSSFSEYAYVTDRESFCYGFFYGSDSGQKVILFNSKHILIEDRLIFLKSWFKAVIVLSWILSCSAKNSNKAITRRFCSFDVSSRAIESWYRIFLPSSFTWSWPTQGVHEAFMFAALQKAKSEFQELVQWASVFILFLKK